MAYGYDQLSDEQLEQRLRERAFEENCELVVERQEEHEGPEWIAAFKQFGEFTSLAPRGVILKSSESDNRRHAMESLLFMAENVP